MLKHKQKKWRQIRMLIIGILIGLLIGVSVIWWFSYLKNANWFFTNNLVTWVSNLFSSSTEMEDNTEMSLVDNKNKKNVKPSIIDEKVIIEDTFYEEDEIDDFYYELSEPLVFEDSLAIFTNELSSEIQNKNEITVKKDELLLKKEIVLNQHIDSKLDSLMGVTPKQTDGQKVTVEFWKSPINYRGYKRSPKKIVIYGVSNHNEAQFVSTEKNVFLIDNNKKYLLKMTDVFLKLEAIKQ
jgi:hypothetical protein